MKTRLIAGMIAQISLAALLATGSAQAQETIKLGFTGALTGPYNEFGEGLRRGILIATEEWNSKGGVNGRKVELVDPLDDQLVPDRAVQNMRRILDNKDIHAIVGPSGSGPSLAVVDMVVSDGRPLCNPQAQTPALVYPNGRDKPPRKNVFSVSVSNAVEAEKFAAVLGGKYDAIGVLHESTGYGVTGADLVKKEIGGIKSSIKITSESFNQRAQDMTAQLVRLQRAGAKAILVIGLGADFAVIRKNMVRLNINLPLYGTAGALTPPYIEGAGDLVVGTLGVNLISLGEPSIAPSVRNFVDRYRAKHGTDRWFGPDANRAQLSLANSVGSGYDCANVLIDAIRRAGSTQPAAVIKALEETKDLKGASVKSISFTADEHTALRTSDLGVYQIAKSGDKIVFELAKD
jgi:branched-chain amino acid transport system substrate-binding protein